MFGAIVGDIIGSVYERHNIKTKDFPLFREDCRFTDDTVMTCSVIRRTSEFHLGELKQCMLEISNHILYVRLFKEN